MIDLGCFNSCDTGLMVKILLDRCNHKFVTILIFVF